MEGRITKEIIKDIEKAVYFNNGFYDVVSLVLIMEKHKCDGDIWSEAFDYMRSIGKQPKCNYLEKHQFDEDY